MGFLFLFFFKIELLAMFDSRSWVCFWTLCRVTTFSISCNSFLHIRTFWHCFNNVAGKISALSSCIILDVPRLTMSAQRQGAGKHVNCSTRCGKRLIYKLLHKYFLQNLQKKKTQIKWYFVTFACACAKEQLIKICLKSAPDVNNYKKSGNRANGRRSLKSVLKKNQKFVYLNNCLWFLSEYRNCMWFFIFKKCAFCVIM